MSSHTLCISDFVTNRIKANFQTVTQTAIWTSLKLIMGKYNVLIQVSHHLPKSDRHVELACITHSHTFFWSSWSACPVRLFLFVSAQVKTSQTITLLLNPRALSHPVMTPAQGTQQKERAHTILKKNSIYLTQNTSCRNNIG